MHAMMHAFYVQIVSTCESGKGEKKVEKCYSLFITVPHCKILWIQTARSAFVTTATSYCFHNEREATHNFEFLLNQHCAQTPIIVIFLVKVAPLKFYFFAKLEHNKSMRTRKILNEMAHFYEFLPEILISPKNFT